MSEAYFFDIGDMFNVPQEISDTYSATNACTAVYGLILSELENFPYNELYLLAISKLKTSNTDEMFKKFEHLWPMQNSDTLKDIAMCLLDMHQ